MNTNDIIKQTVEHYGEKFAAYQKNINKSDDYVLNILITTKVVGKGVINTEIYPIAFRSLDEIDYELAQEGYTKLENSDHRIRTRYVWKEEDLIKTATIKYTTIV